MCGIVGYIGNKKAVPVLIKGLKALEYRGYDSAGVATIELKKKDERTIKIVKESGRVADLEKALKATTNDGVVGIAHTRWATHGMPNKINAHPHYDNSEKIAVVHNGIIENYIEIKKKLEKKGYKLKLETDTEVIPNLISMYYKKDLLKAVRDAVAELEGSYAIEVLSVDNPDEIIVAKKDSPMVIGKGEGENFVASDIPAVLKYTSNFYFMEDKEIAVIKQDQIKFYDMNLKEVKKKIKNIEWDAESSDIVDNGTPRAALQLISPVGLGTPLTITAILQEESSAVRDVGCLWTECQIACRLVVGSEIASSLDENPAMLLTVDNDIVLGVTIGVRVAHLADTGLT